MSHPSPARQDRLERHLGRSRGAGVRTLEADFGFTFAFATLAAVEAPIDTPPAGLTGQDEPPPKRRRTNPDCQEERSTKAAAEQKSLGSLDVAHQTVEILQEDDKSHKPSKPKARRKVRIDEEDDRQINQEAGSPFSKPKARRRHAGTVENGEETAHLQPIPDDPVLQSTKKPRSKKPARKLKSGTDPAENNGTQIANLPAKKPRKKATKCDDVPDIVQDLPAVSATRVPRKTCARGKATGESAAEAASNQELVDDLLPMPKKSRRRDARTADENSEREEIEPEPGASVLSSLLVEPAEVAKPRPGTTKSMKRCAKLAVKSEAQPRIPESKSYISKSPTKASPCENPQPRPSSPPIATEERHEPRSARRPLAEANPNRTLLSPEKVDKSSTATERNLKKATSGSRKITKGTSPPAAVHDTPGVSSKPRDLLVSTDPCVAHGENETVTDTNGKQKSGSAAAHPRIHTVLGKKRQKAEEVEERVFQQEEADDWLFAPQEERKTVSRPFLNTRGNGRASRHTKVSTTHDIDLDDLVSNIGMLVGADTAKTKLAKQKRR